MWAALNRSRVRAHSLRKHSWQIRAASSSFPFEVSQVAGSSFHRAHASWMRSSPPFRGRWRRPRGSTPCFPAKELNALPAKEDVIDITPEMAYKVALEVLTLDGNGDNTLVHNGVYINRSKFKAAVVSKTSPKLVPYDAAEYGVDVGIKVMLGRVEWTVKGTQHGDVVVESEGRLDQDRVGPFHS